MVCDADTVINLNRESSKTRLMGMNVHPSRKTEVEKKDETEELITIKNNSRNSSCSSTISQSSINLNNCNNSMHNNNDSMHSTLGNQMNYSSSDLLSSPSNNNNNLSNDSMSNNINESLKGSEINDKNNSLIENSKNQNPSLLSVLSISSNLNLLEGDLPQTMLENFDIPCGPITPAIATVVMNVLKQGGKLSFKSAHKILRISYKFLSELPNTTHCVVGPEDRLTVVGDLHGKHLSIIYLFIYLYIYLFIAIFSFCLFSYFHLCHLFTFLSSLFIFTSCLHFHCTASFTSYYPNHYHFYFLFHSFILFTLSFSFFLTSILSFPSFCLNLPTGQLPDLIHILEDSGFPSATNKYIFNGKYFTARMLEHEYHVCTLLLLLLLPLRL